MSKNIITAIVAGVVGLVVGYGLASSPQVSLGGTTHFSGLAVSGAVYNSSTLSVEGATDLRSTLSVIGATTLTGETTLGNCGTGSYTVPALSPSFAPTGNTSASTTVTVTGLATGDTAFASWSPPTGSATNTLVALGTNLIGVEASGTNAFVTFGNLKTTTSTASVTGTVTVCYFD